jgi:DNA topoisomerase-3
MKLYIAEKPSLGRALAQAMPGPRRKGEGCIHLGNGDVVSWCIGHLLEQAEPDAYDPEFKRWRMEHLPIVPQSWLLKPRPGTRKQLAILRKLVKAAHQIVHVGDPDREGQLLVDELIDYFKVSQRKRDSLQRCLVNDLTPAAVARSLQQLRDNREFAALSRSALARSRADWLYGINMTRALTLRGRSAGYTGVLSVGRVQTPVLGLVVRRDAEIDNFIPRAFFHVVAHLQTTAGESFRARWQPSEACRDWQDEEGRVLSRELAQNVVSRIGGATAVVTDSTRKVKRQPAPLPFNLSALQIEAARRYAMTAQQVLDTCQILYERHQLLTYPRSDCRYLPTGQRSDAPSVLEAVAGNVTDLAAAAAAADLGLQSKAWNDGKVGAHHAIIPTQKKVPTATLTGPQRKVYELVARQYLAQFYPAHEYSDSQIDLRIAGGLFVARARQTLRNGWKDLFPGSRGRASVAQQTALAAQASKPSEHSGGKSAAPSDEAAMLGAARQDLALNSALPKLVRGDECHCASGELVERETTPPKAFDDASLLMAMTGIARYVHEPQLRKVLKETDGLGTEATRAGIIELLFTRQFLQRRGRQIHSTPAGRALINCLPQMTTTPDMTARWETQLDAISRREASYDSFMQPLEKILAGLITLCRTLSLQDFSTVTPAPASPKRSKTSKPGKRRKKRGAGSSAAKPSRRKKTT